jgi:hypothetical protein
MKRRIWKNKWFILVSIVVMFWLITSAKIALAVPGTDVQLEKILKAGTDGLIAYFNFLLDVLREVWG